MTSPFQKWKSSSRSDYYDCVLLDCSGSMSRVSKNSVQGLPQATLMDYVTTYLLESLSAIGTISKNTLIVPFDTHVRGGLTYDLVTFRGPQIWRYKVRDGNKGLFTPDGGTNIIEAIRYAQSRGEGSILLITDFGERDTQEIVGQTMDVIFVD